MRHFLQVLLCGAVVLGVVSASYADAINVDIQGTSGWGDGNPQLYVGTAAAPDTGTYWNKLDVQSGTSSALIASDGVTATSVSATLSGFGGDYTAHGYPIADGLMGDFAYGNSTHTGSFSIDGLVAGAKYNLYLYAANGVYNNASGDFNINGIDQIAANSGTGSSFVVNNNYVLFSNLTAVGGTIAGSVSGANYAFNGFQITSIPEPGTLVLLASSLVGLLAYAWRKRK